MNKITKFRELRQLSKKELAVLSGLSRQSIHTMEKDVSSCNLKSLMLVADVLRVDVRELI